MTTTIAVAGKGGTGKTTVAVNLALSLASQSNEAPASLENIQAHSPLFLDCDVEEPDTHLFLPVSIERTDEVTLPPAASMRVFMSASIHWMA